jgi:GTPase SAR1 family protein
MGQVDTGAVLSSNFYDPISQDDERTVTREEGLAFAQESGCLFLESSAKTRENVENCFEELVLKVKTLEILRLDNLRLLNLLCN